MTRPENRKTLFIKDLQDGQQVNDHFLIGRKNYAETKAGKPYLALSLMDNSGEIEARVWEAADRYNECTVVGTIITVQAIVTQFRDQLQLNINSLQVAEKEAYSLEDFMPSSRRSSSEMQAELLDIIEGVDNTHLNQLLTNIFQGDRLSQFLTAPAAKMMHHAYLGGLAEHTLSVAGLAMRLCDHYPMLDRNIFIAGCLLHDIGKIEEFDYTTVPFSYTDTGRLVGHLVLGSEMVRREAANIIDFQNNLQNELIHLILSHHGRHEFGSPCLPMTREAILLHHLDDMDAKMNLIDKLSAQVDAGEYQWSDYQRSLERFLLLKGYDEQSAENNQKELYSSPPDARQQRTHEKDNISAKSSENPRQKPLF